MEIERAGPAPAAKEALSRIGQLYTIERRQGRQVLAKPLVIALKAWLARIGEFLLWAYAKPTAGPEIKIAA